MVNTKIRLIIFFAAKDGKALYSQQKQDQELTMAQLVNSLLPNSDLNWGKVGKTTRPFRYDLNQIPCDYTVEVRDRFKGLDLIDRVPDKLWTEVRDIIQEVVIKTFTKKKKCKRQNGCLRGPYKNWEKKRSKRQRRKGKIYSFECRVPQNSKEIRYPPSMINAKK